VLGRDNLGLTTGHQTLKGRDKSRPGTIIARHTYHPAANCSRVLLTLDTPPRRLLICTAALRIDLACIAIPRTLAICSA